MPKYIFVIGGVMSSVGKGVVCASLGAALKAHGVKITALKADPYINVDAGTMNPTEHGEVFVTADGDETDQDMGNYERFLDVNLTRANYMTTGRVYLSVIEKERAMAYKGKCVEVVPHIPQEIIRRIKDALKKTNSELAIVEIGGTVGEYQNILFLEAARMLKLQEPENVIFILVSYMPIPAHVGEMKTKPTQYAARTLNSAGIQADFIVARGERELDAPRREKLAVYCGITHKNVISAPDVESIYDLPAHFEDSGLVEAIIKKFGLSANGIDVLNKWRRLTKKRKSLKKTVKIAVVGKYFNAGEFTLADSYHSVIEAIKHAAWGLGRIPELEWVSAEEFKKKLYSIGRLGAFDGILVPGGWGERGIEGIISSIKYAREKKIPYFGLCYGMQLACVEIARHLSKLPRANTAEIDPETPDPIISANLKQTKNILESKYGGTLRLGAYDCALVSGTLARKVYGQKVISERHRHRYEFNNKYKEILEKSGVVFSGINPESNLVEIIELKNHPFFVGVQFHPEFISRPLRPHPLFSEFIKAAIEKSRRD